MTHSNCDYLFLDLETTGLDPEHDDILEVGAVAVNRLPDLTFQIVAIYSDAIKGDVSKANDFVKKMHTESHLFEDIASRGVTIQEAEQRLGQFLDTHYAPGKLRLAGHSPHGVDLPFTRVHMPTLFEHRISHRLYDTGQLIRSYNDVVKTKVSEGKVDGHRAIADCYGAIRDANNLIERWNPQIPTDEGKLRFTLESMAKQAFPDRDNVRIMMCPGMVVVQCSWPEGDPNFELMVFEHHGAEQTAFHALRSMIL